MVHSRELILPTEREGRRLEAFPEQAGIEFHTGAAFLKQWFSFVAVQGNRIFSREEETVGNDVVCTLRIRESGLLRPGTRVVPRKTSSLCRFDIGILFLHGKSFRIKALAQI